MYKFVPFLIRIKEKFFELALFHFADKVILPSAISVGYFFMPWAQKILPKDMSSLFLINDRLLTNGLS